MRIFTYPNPYEINKNKELWEVVTKHPHFCASDTLVQGLEKRYGRNSFGYLRTIQSLIDYVLGSYTNNIFNDIQLFLEVSNQIRDLEDSNMKSSFRFNIADVVKSIQFMIAMRCDVGKFSDELSAEQKTLLEIYEKVIKTPCINEIKKLEAITKDDFINAARCTINDEIEFIFNKKENIKELNIQFPLNTTKDGYEAIITIIDYLERKMQKSPDDDFLTNLSDDKRNLDKAKHIKTLITELQDDVFEIIVIHGVHRITPMMYFLFKLLEDIGIEIIFLINYADNLTNVYKTWKEVYSWCNTKFEYATDLDMSCGSNLGRAMSNVIEGKKMQEYLTEEVELFSNLTSFTDREVRPTFKNANKELNKMHTQYYAVRGESSNEILKMYFPEQFNHKPFLSYPIGQFILAIYQMWDFDTNTLILNEKSLSECAVSQLGESNSGINLLEFINKTKIYFSDVETVDDYYKRIKELEASINIINGDGRYKPLKKLEFFNLSSEIFKFKFFLEFIETIANKLFKDSSLIIDFGKHFKDLMEIITVQTNNNSALSNTEQMLINEITNKLNGNRGVEVTGSIQDVKDALCLYLAESKKGDTSNWIVRDFEQIDGAVLLNTKKVKEYHFALLSNSHMTNQNDDVLSWPLSNEMFFGYKDLESAIPVVTTGLLERRNFLKFSLFYGVFFTKCKVRLSFIQEENGEEQNPYYLLNVLGLNVKKFEENEANSFIIDHKTTTKCEVFSSEKLERDAKELFSICPYKFLQNVVLKAPIEYHSDYHIKYYVANFMYFFISGKYDLCSNEDIEKIIKIEFKELKKLFPFWDDAVFVDIQKNTLKDLRGYTRSSNKFQQLVYQRRKENFLIAQWAENDEKHMKFKKDNLDQSISNYMDSNQLYPVITELPHKKVCENCNYREICLRDYYEAYTEGDRN